MARKAAFHNLGCRVNSYETEAMTEALRSAGYEIVPFAPGADVYVINTCTVTNIADRKSRQMLHRAKEMNKDAVVVAAGCYVEDGRDRLVPDPAVDLIVGNEEKSRLPELLEDYFRGAVHLDGQTSHSSAEVPDHVLQPYPGIRTAKKYDPLTISDTEGRVRAFIKIQDGCNMFCTYCVIPYVRGRVRSRDPEEIVREAERLADAGFTEVILTGIHISSYGTDFRHEGYRPGTNEDLLALVKRIASVPGVKRVRFGSLEPGIMTGDFVSGIAGIPEVCPQFHLSLQSGCDATLARMRRRYTTYEYAEICERIRGHFPDAAITTDVIVGFPGETEEEFGETLAFVGRISFAKIHIFKYSRRDGTKAAVMPEQVPESVKARRAAVLAGVEATLRRSYLERFAGKICEVLVEEQVRALPDGSGLYRGHTREASEALIASREDLSGRILRVRAENVTQDLRLLCSLNCDGV